jgi:hypothetical protein
MNDGGKKLKRRGCDQIQAQSRFLSGGTEKYLGNPVRIASVFAEIRTSLSSRSLQRMVGLQNM